MRPLNVAKLAQGDHISRASLLRQLARAVVAELATKHASQVAKQPGALFFEKRIHQLLADEHDSPDGLSLGFLRLAMEKNAAIGETATASPFGCLAADVCREISHAVVLEKLLIMRTRKR